MSDLVEELMFRAADEIKRLRAERDALREDAERWRYAGHSVEFVLLHDASGDAKWPECNGWIAFDTKEKADAAIDAARKAN
jgi:hypothetical protein